MEKKSTHGGSGRNQGRKKQWDEKTATISFRLPESLIGKIKAAEHANKRAYKALKKEFK